MKSVWLACQDYGYDGWAILGVFSSEEKANSYLESRPIIVRPYQSLPNELLPSKWVIDVEGELTFVSPDQSLSGAIVEAGKRSHLYVEEWEVDEVPE